MGRHARPFLDNPNGKKFRGNGGGGVIQHGIESLSPFPRRRKPPRRWIPGRIDEPEDLRPELSATAYVYNGLDQLTKTDGDGNISVAVYDETGNRTQLETAGRTTSYSFDALNRVQSVSHGGSPVASYSWNRASQPVGITRANGTSTVYGYDNAGRLTGLGHDLGNNRIAGFEYSYTPGDGMDLVSRLREYRPAGSLETTSYTYDSAARLTSWAVAGASPYTTTLTLGNTGDRLTETTTGAGAKTRTYSYNSRHQLTGLTDSASGQLVYQWDNEGRLLSKGAPLAPSPKTFTWDSRDRLKAVEEAFSAVAEYRYEETGLKVESFWPALAAAQQTRRYQWVGRELLAVRAADNSVVSRIVRGIDREILGHETGGNSFVQVHADRLGSVSAETDLSGTITHSRVYDPFGNVRTETGSSEMPLGYTGQEMDPVTGLVQMKARWYDPDAGIFISEDPRSYSPLDPFSLHEYLYANADPVNWMDPTGEVGEKISQTAGNPTTGKAETHTYTVISEDSEIENGTLRVRDEAGREIACKRGGACTYKEGKPEFSASADWAFKGFAQANREKLDRVIGKIKENAAAGFFSPALAASDTIEVLKTIALTESEDEFVRAVSRLNRSLDIFRHPITTTLEGLGQVYEMLKSGDPGQVAYAVGLITSAYATYEIGKRMGSGEGRAATGEGIVLDDGTAVKPQAARLPQDVNVKSKPPDPRRVEGRTVGKSPAQNAAVQADAEAARRSGASDIRINQQQVNAQGKRVGVNRPDLQYTTTGKQRVYIEYDRSTSNRAKAHMDRLQANDPCGLVVCKTID